MSAEASNPKLHVLFPTFLNEARYPAFEQQKVALIERIRKIQLEDLQGRQWSQQHYPNGYTSFHSRNRLFEDSSFDGLVRFMGSVAEDFASRQHWDMQSYRLVMTQMWCNINGQFSFHRDHVHPYSQISGVFYLQCDGTSPSITIKDPRTARWMVPPPVAQNRPENLLSVSIPPREGMLLMFPAWLDHGVPQNLSSTERISISFNFDLQHLGYPPQ